MQYTHRKLQRSVTEIRRSRSWRLSVSVMVWAIVPSYPSAPATLPAPAKPSPQYRRQHTGPHAAPHPQQTRNTPPMEYKSGWARAPSAAPAAGGAGAPEEHRINPGEAGEVARDHIGGVVGAEVQARP